MIIQDEGPTARSRKCTSHRISNRTGLSSNNLGTTGHHVSAELSL